MGVTEVEGIAGMQDLLGKEIGPGEWRQVTQSDINDFADVSGDHQWIHVDVDRAERESPYGKTIAHGNLTLSLVDGLREKMLEIQGVPVAINYGWNKIRFPAPVPVDSKIRARLEITSIDEVGGGWWQTVTKVTLEIEGGEKPCFAGESVARWLAEEG